MGIVTPSLLFSVWLFHRGFFLLFFFFLYRLVYTPIITTQRRLGEGGAKSVECNGSSRRFVRHTEMSIQAHAQKRAPAIEMIVCYVVIKKTVFYSSAVLAVSPKRVQMN